MTRAAAGTTSADQSFISGARRQSARLLCGAAIAVLSLASQAAPLLGAYRWEPPHNSATLKAFESWLGRPLDFGTGFQGAPNASHGWKYTEGLDWQLGGWSNWINAKPGRTFSYAVAMFPSGMGITLAQVAAGQHDARYVKLANQLARYGMLNIYLRIGHEMDGGWFAWGAKAGRGKEANFAAAFRRIVQVMRNAQPSNNWKIVWNPTCDSFPVSGAAAYFESLWPGDDVVDIVGVDCYDKSFGTGKVYYPSGSNRLQRQQEVWATLAPRLNILRDFAVRHGKTMGFPEWGLITYSSSSRYVGWGGGDNPYFIQKMHEFFMDPENRVVMQSYFDVSNSHEGDYRVGPDSRYPQSQARFKQLFGATPTASGAPTVPVTSPQAGQTGSSGVTSAPPSGGATVTSAPPSGGATVSAPVSQATDSTTNTRARPLPLKLR
jgi:hypothetical protein